MTCWKTTTTPGMNYFIERVDQTLHCFNVLNTLLTAAEREQQELWAWSPTIHSNEGSPTRRCNRVLLQVSGEPPRQLCRD